MLWLLHSTQATFTLQSGADQHQGGTRPITSSPHLSHLPLLAPWPLPETSRHHILIAKHTCTRTHALFSTRAAPGVFTATLPDGRNPGHWSHCKCSETTKEPGAILESIVNENRENGLERDSSLNRKQVSVACVCSVWSSEQLPFVPRCLLEGKLHVPNKSAPFATV